MQGGRDPTPARVYLENLEEASHWRTSERGMHHRTREAQYPEIFGYFDPDALAPDGWRLPDDVQVAFEETFGEAATTGGPDGRGRVICRLHPHFRRVVVFEWCWSPGIEGKAPGHYWHPRFIVCEPVDRNAKHVAALRPADLREARFSELWGKVGEWKLPDRTDFEDYIECCDRERFTALERHKKLQEKKNAKVREFELQAADFERDFLDYYFALYSRDINRVYGSMQGLPFVPQTDLREEDGKVRFPVLNTAGEVSHTLRVRANAWLGAYELELAAEGKDESLDELSDEGLMRLFEKFKLLECAPAVRLRTKIDGREKFAEVTGFVPGSRNLSVGGAAAAELEESARPSAADPIAAPADKWLKQAAQRIAQKVG